VHARLLLPVSALLLAACAASCAVNDGRGSYDSSSAEPPPAAARIGLPPEYRVFYDELADLGDWVLIEPYGWCFRPRVNFVAWRPYQQGWWEPSDRYGWVWISTEDFGDITYHYGSWFYDDYQGWVWQPGLVWGPAWVAWTQADDYIGWAPLGPSSYTGYDRVPGGVFTYAQATQFATRQVGSQAMFVTRLPTGVGGVHAIANVGHENGVAFNMGPDLTTLQRLGALPTGQADVSKLTRVSAAAAPRQSESDLLARMSRVQGEAVRELSALRQQGVAPPPLPASLPRPPAPAPAFAPPGAGAGAAHAHHKAHAPADSTHVKKKLHHAPGGPPHPAADSTRAR